MKISIVLLALAACASNAPSTPAPPAPPAPVPAGERGKVVDRTFHSNALGVDKHYLVYLPSGYDAKPTAKWPVLYYLHGLGGNEKSWVKGGHIDEAADRLGLQALIVMPDGDDGFYIDSLKTTDYDSCIKNGTGLLIPTEQDPPTQCVKHFAYETYIVKELLADVDAHYHTNATREGRGIAGFSMGGLGAWELGLRYPTVFAAAASHSGYISLRYKGPHPYEAGKASRFPLSVEPSGNPMIDWVRSVFGSDLTNWDAHDPSQLINTMTAGHPALYLDCGTEDEFKFQDSAQYVHDTLDARHIEHAFFLGPGHHDFDFWRPREVESLRWLQEHVAKP